MIISIAAFGEDQLSREILRVGEHAANMEPAIAAVYEQFLESETKLFDSEGASGGNAWAPLADSTVQGKAAAGLDPRILHATLTLRNSLTNKGDENAEFEMTPDGAFMGSTVTYGIYHQSTQPRKMGPGGEPILPRRPPVMLTEDEKVAWIKILQRWIITGELL